MHIILHSQAFYLLKFKVLSFKFKASKINITIVIKITIYFVRIGTIVNVFGRVNAKGYWNWGE